VGPHAVRWLALGLAGAAAVAGLRFGLLATRQRRASAARARGAVPVPPPTIRTRLARALAWPVFLALVAVVLAAGVAAGMLIGWTR
jgi:hypothetical protein